MTEHGAYEMTEMTEHRAYEETQTPDPFFGAPQDYTLYLACPPAGGMTYIEVDPDSDAPTKFAVTGIPASVPPMTVARHLATIAIAVHPDALRWSAVSDLKPGTLVKSRRDGRIVYVRDDAHWTGRSCIGWMHDRH